MRCLHESQLHPSTSFLTLTYRDVHLKWGHQVPTLYPRDLQLFFKRLRKAYKHLPLKFFACGEYGDKTGRPHYHVILFGHDFQDDRIRDTSIQASFPFYRSSRLDKIWGMGDCLIGDATFDSMAYTARYVLKKLTGKQSGVYTTLGIEPEFSRVSRGGRGAGSSGLSSLWYDKYSSDVFPDDFVVVEDGVKISPPVYYKRKLLKSNPDLYFRLVRQRADAVLSDPDRNTLSRLFARARIVRARFDDVMRDFE